jgi:Flp pilus assembly pilin Flp
MMTLEARNPPGVRVGACEGKEEQRMQLVNEALLRILSGWHGLQARLSDEEGQTLAEYGLIMAVIAVAVVVAAVIAFRGAIVTAFTNATGCLDGSC